MKKFLLSCLAFGALAFSASAAEQTLTVTGTQLGLKNGYSKASYGDVATGFTVTVNGTSQNGNIQLGANSKAGNWLAVTGNTNNYTIKSVAFTEMSTASSKPTTLKVYGNSAAYTDLDGAITETPAGTEVLDFSLTQNETSTQTATVNAPYFVAYNSTNGGQIGFTNIVITYEDGQSSDLKSPEISAVEATKSYVLSAAYGEISITDLFNNPNNLALKVTSSNDKVAVYAFSKIMVTGAGTTTITATFDGNDEYQKASANVTLNVIKGVADIKAFLELADNAVAEFNNPVTIVYNGGKYLFVQDASGYLQLYNNSTAFPAAYQPGQTLSGFRAAKGAYGKNPQGNTAGTFDTFPAEAEGEATEIAPAVLTVDALTEADYNRYVQFENVTLTQDNNKWYVDDVQLYDRFNLSLLSDVKTDTEYNVTGIYVIYNTTKELFITAISEVSSETPVLEFPTEINVTSDSNKVEITSELEDDRIMVTVTGKSVGDNFDLIVEIPEGWDGILAYDSSVSAGPLRTAIEDNDDEWQPLSDMLAYYEAAGTECFTGNTITVPTDGNPHIYMCMLYADNKVYTGNAFMVFAQVEEDTSVGIEAIGAAEADAVYFDLNGRRVAGKLLPGIYVKNVNGKVSKELVK